MAGHTAIIEAAIEKTWKCHAASIQSISDNVKSQQKQFMEQQNQIKDMFTMVTSIPSLIKKKFNGDANPTIVGKGGHTPPFLD